MQLQVTVEQILFPKEGQEGSWFMLRTNQGVVKGKLSWRPRELEVLSLSGEYVEYKGEQQFKFNSAKLSLPSDSRAQLNYVCERTKGIGPELTAAIWEAMGEHWRELSRGEIKGLSDRAYNNFKEQIQAFETDSEKAETVSWLESKGASAAMANAAWAGWGNATMGIVNSDCFRLAELPGFSFKAVDMKVRQNFGIADDDRRRLRSGIIYALNQLTSDGSTVIGIQLHKAKMGGLLPGVSGELLGEVAGEMIKDGSLKVFGGAVAWSKDFEMERDIFRFASEVAEAEESGESPVAGEWLESYSGDIVPDTVQKNAVKLALSGKFTMINGGAGTGKTTIIKLICEGLEKFYPEREVRLCALAGKAAARLKEATRRRASTIHSMLGYNGVSFQVQSLTGSAVIIDEASMADIALLAEIVRRRPDMLIMVGDQAQLPPVGKGQPFHDMLEIFPGRVCTLQNCYRNKEAVFRNAMKIRNGENPEVNAKSDNEQWDVLETGDGAATQSVLCEWVKKGFLDFDTDIILCPKNGEREDDDSDFSPATVNALNMAIAQIVNPGDRGDNGMKIIAGDRVINIKNCAEKDVWNGTTGRVESVNDKGEMFVRLDTPIIDISRSFDAKNPVYTDMVHFTREMVKSLRLAYALTVHKSQGSQYRRVIMVCLTRDVFNMDRSMIYTGVTRTREHCVVAGDGYALLRGIETTKCKETVMQYLAEATE